jgi:orotate phosphoribosyltransferase
MQEGGAIALKHIDGSPTSSIGSTGNIVVRSDARAMIADYVRSRCIHHAPERRLISRSGGYQSWLIDLRSAFLDARMLDLITDLFWDRFRCEVPFQIGGMEMAAVPLVTALLLKARGLGLTVNGFIVRKERKTYGTGNLIEGFVSDDPVLLVDDVINSGASFEKACVVIESLGHAVKKVFAVIDYRSVKGAEWRTTRNLLTESMFDLEEFDLKIAAAQTSSDVSTHCDPIWRFEAPNGHPHWVVPKSAPRLADGALYFGADNANFYSLDVQTGATRWRFETKTKNAKGIRSTCRVENGRVYFGAYDGNVYCLDAGTGAVCWTSHVCEWVGSSPVIVAKHDLLYIGLEYDGPGKKGGFAALSLTSGKKIWELMLREFQHGSGAYAENCDLVVFGTNDNSVVAIDAKTGRACWSFATRGPVKTVPVVDELRKLVCFASFDRSIYILDLETGEKLSEIVTGGNCYTSPLIASDRLFCGSGDRNLYVVDLNTFELLFKVDLRARVYSSPSLSNGNVLVGTHGGRVFGIDVCTLSVRSLIQVPDAVTDAVTVDPDGLHVYVPTYMNQIYAFRLSSR